MPEILTIESFCMSSKIVCKVAIMSVHFLGTVPLERIPLYFSYIWYLTL